VKTIVTVFRKELVDTLRDRRTLVFMVVIPLLLFPVLFRVMFSVEKSQSEKARTRQLKVAYVDNGAASEFVSKLEARKDVVLTHGLPLDSLLALVRNDSLDGVFVIAPDFDDMVAELKPGRVDFYYKSTDDRTIVRNRLQETLDEYERELLDERFQRLEMDASIVDAVEMKSHNVASLEERVGKSVGGMLPYMFIIFCFMGSMYPAIDLGAAIVSMGGLYIGIKQAPDVPPEFLDLIVKLFGWHTIVMLFSLLLPLTIFFAGVLLSVSLTARSFKEAQSLISPLNIAVILPAAIGLIPGVTMSYATALVPILNVSLATKEILAGTIKAPHLILVYVSLILLAVGSLYGSAWWFRRESTIFRS
jgi:sodium transport system permease protein